MFFWRFFPSFKILGYKSHAAYVLEVKMAKTVEAVETVSSFQKTVITFKLTLIFAF